MSPVVEGFKFVAACLIIGVLLGLLISGCEEPTRQGIAAPCRDNGGVAQYIAKDFFNQTGDLVICRDGEVGEVR